jgi:hypothetical protein
LTRAVSGRGSPYAYDHNMPIIFPGAKIRHGAQMGGLQGQSLSLQPLARQREFGRRPHWTDIPRHSWNTEGGGSGSTRKCVESQTFNLPLPTPGPGNKNDNGFDIRD